MKMTGMSNVVFKQLFFVEGNEELLKEFLEDVLEIEIKDFKVLTPVLSINKISKEPEVVELIVQADEKIINIEVNNYYYDCINYRNFGVLCILYTLYYEETALANDCPYEIPYDFPYILQLNLSMDLPKMYDESCRYDYQLMDQEGNLYDDNQKITEFNMNKIKEMYYDPQEGKIKENAPHYAPYLIMLMLNSEELKKLYKGDELMEKMKKRIVEISSDELAKAFFTAEEDERRIRNTIRSEGIDEGAKSAKTEIAKKLLKKQISEEDILEICKLTKEELEDIKST